MYLPVLYTAAAEQPVTLAEAKKQVELAGAITYHDDQLERLIKAATQLAEERTHRQILTATYDWTLDKFPAAGEAINVPYPPLQSVTSITYTDTAGDSQTLAATVYKVIVNTQPGRIVLKRNQSWPSVYDEAGSVTIRFVAGYADTADELAAAEELLKAGVLLAVQAYWMRDHQQPFDRHLKAALDLFELYAPGDEFLDYP